MNLGKLSPEARERRRVKNLRNRNRQHPQGSVHKLDMPVGGAFWRTVSRLETRGNCSQRGVRHKRG